MKMKWDLTPMLKLGVYSPDELLRRLSAIAEEVQGNGADVSAKVWIDDEYWIQIERDSDKTGWQATAGYGDLIEETACTVGGLSFENAVKGGLAYYHVDWTKAIEQSLAEKD